MMHADTPVRDTIPHGATTHKHRPPPKYADILLLKSLLSSTPCIPAILDQTLLRRPLPKRRKPMSPPQSSLTTAINTRAPPCSPRSFHNHLANPSDAFERLQIEKLEQGGKKKKTKLTYLKQRKGEGV